MSEEEITALAREYAEEATKADAGDPNLSATDLNGIKHDVAEYAEEVIRFLLRRYCLAAKDVVKNFYQSRKDFLAHQNEYDRDIVNDIWIEVRLLSCMFPEIAKEVEE